MSMLVEDYSDKAIVVRGPPEISKQYREEFLKLNGKWNPKLKGGGGWIFSKKRLIEIDALLKRKGDSESKSESAPESNPLDLPVSKNCDKYSKNIDVKKSINDIQEFCAMLRANKVKDTIPVFLKLPEVVQCMFLEYAWSVLSNKSKYTDDAYLTAFRLFKLFRNKDVQKNKTYARFMSNSTVETVYKKAFDWNKKQGGSSASPDVKGPVPKGPVPKGPVPKGPVPKRSPISRRTSSKSPGSKYDKEYQRYASPPNDTDPSYIFYTSLLNENPKSRLSITWLTEHGVFEGSERDNLIKKYKKLLDANKIIK
jgi:hypothetical protein